MVVSAQLDLTRPGVGGGSESVNKLTLACVVAATALGATLRVYGLACAVIHLRDSHFFSLDVSMTFFTVLTWYFLMRTVARGDLTGDVGSAVGFGLGIASKYSAAFLAPLVGLAQLLSPTGPRGVTPL